MRTKLKLKSTYTLPKSIGQHFSTWFFIRWNHNYCWVWSSCR